MGFRTKTTATATVCVTGLLLLLWSAQAFLPSALQQKQYGALYGSPSSLRRLDWHPDPTTVVFSRFSHRQLTNSRLFTTKRSTRARDLLESLIQEEECFSTDAGAQAFASVCAPNIIYQDCFEPQPIVGKTPVTNYLYDKVAQRQGRGSVRLDKISDGDTACGFAWTWISGNEEGLRGTTFCQLDEQGKICFVQEIPEPIYKPGDLTKDLLQALTAGAEPKPPQPFERKTPNTASELARYLYCDLQNADPKDTMQELLRFIDDNIVYRDFNYEHVMTSPDEVRQFVEDFMFPGIEFRPLKFDDGVQSTCFTWEVVLEGAPDTIKGMSFYELGENNKIVYIRDVPESAIKPPILGKLARQLRPGLGVFRGVPLGSRPGGL